VPLYCRYAHWDLNNLHRFGGESSRLEDQEKMAVRDIHCIERTLIGQNWRSIVSGALVSETVLLASDT